MDLNPAVLQALREGGVAFSITDKDLRALSKNCRTLNARKPSRLRGTVFFLAAVVIFIGLARLSEGFPHVLTRPFFVGLILGAAGLTVMGLALNKRDRRQRASDERIVGERRFGIHETILWCYQNEAFSLFSSPEAFTRIAIDGDYIFAYLTRNVAHIFPQAVLMRSEEGKAVHAWLARAKAELEFGGR